MFKHGDLIFTQIGSGANAISAVTEGYRGARINHIGVVVLNIKGTYVLEAFPPEVRVTQIAVHLRRSAYVTDTPRFLLGRLNEEHAALIPAAIEYGLQQRNKPYDQLYLTDEGSLYCSELVIDMFKSANNGVEFFVEKPMSFIDLVTGDIHPVWIEYYAKFGMEVPAAHPGSNPGDISKDDRITIVHAAGPITGYVAP